MKDLLNIMFDIGKKRGRIEERITYAERLELENKIIFEILPFSRMLNVSPTTRTRIRKEAAEKTELTQKEKDDIEKAISLAQEKYNADTSYIPIPRLCVFFGGWYCPPLKEYMQEKKYEIYACGNDFDLLVTLKNN